MQRHRKKDRSERAPPTIQKYLHGTAGSPIGNTAPSPGTNENLYQSCVGGNVTKAAGLACCRKDDLMFHTTPTPGPGSYPEDDPDCIEVYKEQQQQKNDDHRHKTGSRTQDQPFAGKWCVPNVNQLVREVGNLHTPLGDALLHHHQHHQQEQQQQQQQQQQLLLTNHPNVLSAGSAEYSYAYCEPMLLQRPAATGDGTAEQQKQQQQLHHTPVSTLSSSGSSYCVPVYAQRQQLQQQHAPSLPLLQRPFRQPSAIRNPYQYTYGPPSQGSADSGTNTTTTTLHHHHHHHHHHSNYTLPNASAASNSSATSTTRTGSLRALFSNIFRKSSASSAAHPLSAAAHSAPFLELDGSGGTLQRSSFGGGSSLLGAERHSFTTCYGTKENIYEDIGSQTGLGTVGAESGAAAAARELSVAACVSGSSTAPAGPPPPPPPPLPPSGASSPTAAPLVAVGGQQDSVAAERRRVQVQHDRIIGELNLSVERLIMPSCDDESVQPRDQHASRCQEYSELQDAYDCKQMVIMGQKGSFCRSAVGYDGANVAVAGGMNTSMGGLRLSTKRHFPVPTPAAAAATSSSSPPPTLGAGSERHSPTVSYGKSYGDVDSGISSSSTSGTSYSSSILYRSITNYPQQQQQQQHQQQQQQPAAHHHPPRTKHSLFNLHLGSAGSAGPNRAPCCRGPKDQSIVSRPEGFVGLAGGGSANAVVTNAPDPPPPPDTSLLSYVCPTSDGSYGPIARLPNTSVSSQTLTSCCFLSDHNLAERESASRPFAATFAYNHHHHNNHHHQPQRGSSARASNGGNGSGNFWARFRKLRLPTGSGGKLFSASERHVDTELHLEDFTGESMWPEPGPRPVYHHPLHGGPPPPHHQLALLPLDPHMMPPCALPSTAAPLNGNLPPPPPAASHQRTLHPFGVPSESTGVPPNRAANGDDEEEEDGSERPPQRSCSPSTPSSVASTAASSGSSSSSSVSPSSPMSPGSSSSCSSGATKHSGNESNGA